MHNFNLLQKHLLYGSILVSGAILLGFVLQSLIFRYILRKSATDTPKTRHLIWRYRRPARWLFLTAGAMLGLAYLPIPWDVHVALRHILQLIFIAELAWVAVTSVDTLEEVFVHRYDTTQADNARARRVRTQMQVVRRLAIILIVILTLGIMLYSFDNKLAKYGAGLLASAGLASLALAAAAKSSVSNILAGLQIAISESIRIDDVVIVDNEWGWIEEITNTYVVVRIWDWRRLIVPLSYFIEKPFQNWTRQSAALMGTCFLYVDYTVPVEPLREELRRVLESTPLWDTSKKVCVLQVTEFNERCMQLRCLMSARNSGELWDLRCYVREKMITYIQEKYPQSLPLQRLGELTVKNAGPTEQSFPGSPDRVHDRHFDPQETSQTP
ncbi:MAG TPA: mechanosensitive ion channel domain-containing protein [Acidobacteriaceae bacterium]|nr:mechanosensitive ion channel domain-containing protein [Acidobacteriaceae bacterium]